MKGLISTVGLTVDILEFSVLEIKPDYICLLCSQESLSYAADVKRKLSLTQDKLHVEIVDEENPLDIVEKFHTSANWLENRGVELKQMAVDITCGTAVLRGAVAIAAGFLGVTTYFVHCPGTTLETLEEVEFTKLQIITLGNPYETLGFVPLRSTIDHFNRHDYELAASLFRDMQGKSSSIKRGVIYTFLCVLAESYREWDLFRYSKANELLREAIGELKGIVKEENCLNPLLASLEQNKQFLEQLLGKTKGLAVPSPLLVLDIYCNGLRTMALNRLTDAAVRFYRCVEAAAQFRLYDRFNIDSSNVDAKSLNEVAQKFEETTGMSLPQCLALDQDYVLLKILDDDLAKKISYDDLKAIQFTRNHSILAHDFRSLSGAEVGSLEQKTRTVVKELFEMEELDYEELLVKAKHVSLSYEVLRSVVSR